MTDTTGSYRDWVCDGDAYLRNQFHTRGWWAARGDTDLWIEPDGTLIEPGVND